MNKTKIIKFIFINLIIITLIVLFNWTFINPEKSTLISEIIQHKKAKKTQIKQLLEEKIQKLKEEKAGSATLNHITQEWLDKEITEYECWLTEDASIKGKKIVTKQNNKIHKFILDEDLNIINDEEESNIEITYEAKARQDEMIDVVATVSTDEGIKQIEYLNENYIQQCNGKKNVAKDYKIPLGAEYKIKVTTITGEEKTETIVIEHYYHDIIKNLEDNVNVSNKKAIKAEYNQPYEETMTVTGENRILSKFDVIMAEEKIDVDKKTAKIQIEKVTGDIEITATSKIAEIEISDIIIGKTKTATESVADHSQPVGTTLYIRFTATIEDYNCTINPEIPYKVTEASIYKFAIEEMYGGNTLTKEVEVNVRKYDIYEIWTIQELKEMSEDLGGYYKLMTDLDLSSVTNWTPIGTSDARFTGTFNGSGYTISNMKMTRTENYGGLFGYIDEAEIKNLRLKNYNISLGGSSYVGSLVGYSIDSIITNIFAKGEMKATEESNHSIGGLIGGSTGSTQIRQCYTEGNINKSNYSISGAGGITGGLYGSSIIKNSYSAMNITGTVNLGGIAGSVSHTGSIVNSYAIGKIEGNSDADGRSSTFGECRRNSCKFILDTRNNRAKYKCIRNTKNYISINTKTSIFRMGF